MGHRTCPPRPGPHRTGRLDRPGARRAPRRTPPGPGQPQGHPALGAGDRPGPRFRDEVVALAFSADGSQLAAGDGTGKVALWDGRLRQRAGILRNVFPRLARVPESASEVAFSPDGRTLAVGSTLAVGGTAGTLQLGDPETQLPLGDALTTPGDAVASLSFSPDGTTVYAVGAHVPLQRYVIDPGRAVAEVGARAGHVELTRAQWRTYVGDMPCQKVCGR